MSTSDTTPFAAEGYSAETTGTTLDTPAQEPLPDDAARPARPRTGTMVWGLVLLLVGASVAAVGIGATLDLGAVLIGLLLVAGTALLVGSILATRRRT